MKFDLQDTQSTALGYCFNCKTCYELEDKLSFEFIKLQKDKE